MALLHFYLYCVMVCAVMDNGSAAEFGSPKELLEKGGIFASLVDSTGAESSLALRDIAARSGVST